MNLPQIKETIKILESLPCREHAKPGEPYFTYGAEAELKTYKAILPELERLTKVEKNIKSRRKYRRA